VFIIPGVIRKAFSFALIAFALVVPGAVAADPPNVVDQYTEQLPDPGGEKPAPVNPGGEGGSGDETSAGAVPSTSGPGTGGGSTATADPAATGSGSDGSSDGAGDSASPVTATDGSAVGDSGGSKTAIDTGDEGMGPLFPILLIGGMVAAIAVLLIRRGTLSSRAG